MQPLPGVSEATLDRLEQNVAAINSVSKLVAEGFAAKDIIARLFEGLEIGFSEENEVFFRCQCSRSRIESMLRGLGRDELRSMIDDGKAEVCCRFCNEKYNFTKRELEALLHDPE